MCYLLSYEQAVIQIDIIEQEATLIIIVKNAPKIAKYISLALFLSMFTESSLSSLSPVLDLALLHTSTGSRLPSVQLGTSRMCLFGCCGWWIVTKYSGKT